MIDIGIIILCKSCGHRAPFYLYKPARKYPGMVHCPKCDSDNTEAESNFDAHVQAYLDDLIFRTEAESVAHVFGTYY